MKEDNYFVLHSYFLPFWPTQIFTSYQSITQVFENQCQLIAVSGTISQPFTGWALAWQIIIGLEFKIYRYILY